MPKLAFTCGDPAGVGPEIIEAWLNAHVGHDCAVADDVVLANNVMLAGHVQVGAFTFIGGGAGVHQFARIGESAMISGL